MQKLFNNSAKKIPAPQNINDNDDAEKGDTMQ